MWMSEVEMKVWMRGRPASCTAPNAASTSATCARARPVMIGPSTWRAIACTASKSPGLLGDLQLLLRVQRDARRLLAVPQRRVEDLYAVHVSPSSRSRPYLR